MRDSENQQGGESPRIQDFWGVVFDLDGTLIISHHDFSRMQGEVIRAAVELGAPPQNLIVTEPIGTSQIIGAAFQELRAVDPNGSLIERFEKEISKRLDRIELESVTRTVLRPGALDLLRNLNNAGYRLALFTRSSEGFCREVAAHLGLDRYFSYVRTRSSAGPAKPSPAALQLLLDLMEVPADRALYIGDHSEDARCALGLGVAFCGVLPAPGNPDSTSSDLFRSLGARRVVANLDEIPTVLGELFSTSSMAE